jgi:hypothetical protein
VQKRRQGVGVDGKPAVRRLTKNYSPNPLHLNGETRLGFPVTNVLNYRVRKSDVAALRGERGTASIAHNHLVFSGVGSSKIIEQDYFVSITDLIPEPCRSSEIHDRSRAKEGLESGNPAFSISLSDKAVKGMNVHGKTA